MKELAAYLDSMLMLELYERAEQIAAELDTTPSAWLHRQVEFMSDAVQAKRRGHLRSV